MTTAQACSTGRAENEATEREKFYADLNRTRAETEKMYAEMRKLNMDASRHVEEVLKIRAETEKADADAKKLMMDATKAQLEIRWYPYAVIGSLGLAWLGAGAALITALIKLFALWGQMLGS
jgi:sugar diacid utilization regulator